jgi:His-Xaa-Ser system radical SAM maturase HxsC
MCSQPPLEHDDPYLLSESIKIIRLADSDTPVLGITGGEPTLLDAELLRLIELTTQLLPNTQLHLLTNGRLLQNKSYAKKLAAICRANLTVALPLYSDIDNEHDFIVQAKGGFAQTVRGILNLACYKIPIEIRVVIHKLNYQRLPQIAEFIYRNLTFTNHVALMALEPIGFAADNIELLWIDPFEYRAQLSMATRFLADRGINTSIYNHQLCTIPEELRSYSCKSISDWKVVFLECCKMCSCMNNCGGFFESALPKHHSAYIKPL